MVSERGTRAELEKHEKIKRRGEARTYRSEIPATLKLFAPSRGAHAIGEEEMKRKR